MQNQWSIIMQRGAHRIKPRLLYIVVILVGIVALVLFLQRNTKQENMLAENDKPEESIASQVITSNIPLPMPSFETCRMHNNDCFNIYRCRYNKENKISVYIYPFTNYFDEQGLEISPSLSREFYELITAIRESMYITASMEKACIIIPSLDTLNQRRIDIRNAGRILSSLSIWRQLGGRNHLIFNMIPGQNPDFNTSLDVHTDKAIVAGGGFHSRTYRAGFDVSIPVFNSLTQLAFQEQKMQIPKKKWFLLSTQVHYDADFRSALEKIADSMADVLILNHCAKDDLIHSRCNGDTVYIYPHILQSASFCLVFRGMRLGQSSLLDVLMTGCIPVIVADNYVLPFSEVIDWSRAAVLIREEQITSVYKILKMYTPQEITGMKKQVAFLWTNYFCTMKKIALTTIKIINDRIFPNAAWFYEHWNTPNLPSSGYTKNILHPPFIIPLMSPKKNGFTAVVLTYDRIAMLFRVLKQVSRAPSLTKIVVVWNNINKRPPQVSEWPRLTKPVEVIETKANKLTNRFFPYTEIETEGIFSLDDDIDMLTSDEIEFAFQVWSEFPDRLVGFPGRFHTSENGTNRLKYESEWLNNVSMVLTGAAFHHKFYNHLFTYVMPARIRKWIDQHMNCEDIVMNFLVANHTGKAPIKVTPRKRFKCPECANGDALGANQIHFMERSACIQECVRFFGNLPLRTAEFRADPVLHQDDIPAQVKKFKNVGTI